MYRKSIMGGVLCGALALSSFAGAFAAQEAQTESRETQIAEGIDIFSKLVRELDMFYVDTLQVRDMVEKGINNMLEEIDPYTIYVPQKNQEDLRFMTTGEYAGVGSVISQRSGRIIINEVYEGTPSHKSGLQVGDVILSVDTFKAEGKTTSDVSERLRGIAGTQVSVRIKRAMDGKEEEKKITREIIQISPIPLATMIPNTKTGIIQVTSFTSGAAKEFKQRFWELKQQGMESLIIDLRDNPGGLLPEAVDIVNMFVAKNETVVYTDGKVASWNEKFKAEHDPTDLEIPLLVMVDGGSASAAEIVSGALQDLDRAVIMGERTYGKGLVQTTRELPYGCTLKLTISKYYIPSGRCIQAIDYANRDKEGHATQIPDSLTHEFKTKGGRIVRDGCGILPDVEYKIKKYSDITYHLYTKEIIFDYVTEYLKKKGAPKSVEALVYNDYDGFKEFVVSKDFSYKNGSQEMLEKLKKQAEKDSLMAGAKKEFEALENALMHCQDLELDKAREEIEAMIRIEICKRAFFQKGAAEESLRHDDEVKAALAVVGDKEKMKEILSAKTKEEEKK